MGLYKRTSASELARAGCALRGDPPKKKPECLRALRVELESMDTGNWRLAHEVLTTDQTEADERRTEQRQGGGFRSARRIL